MGQGGIVNLYDKNIVIASYKFGCQSELVEDRAQRPARKVFDKL